LIVVTYAQGAGSHTTKAQHLSLRFMRVIAFVFRRDLNNVAFRFLVVTSATKQLQVINRANIAVDVVNRCGCLSTLSAGSPISGKHGRSYGRWDLTLSGRITSSHYVGEPDLYCLLNIRVLYPSIAGAPLEIPNKFRFFAAKL
jgi:hypothetical protein